MGNDKPGSLSDPNVIFGNLYAEGYLMFGLGVSVGGFYDRSSKNYGLYWSFELGGGLGGSAGVVGGVAKDLSSFQGVADTFGAGVLFVSGNYMFERGKPDKPIAVSGGVSANLMAPLPLPASVHASSGMTTLFRTSLPSCN